MKAKDIIVNVLLSVAVLFLGVTAYLVVTAEVPGEEGLGGQSVVTFIEPSQSTVTVNADTATQVVATNTARTHLIISNNSTEDAWLSYGAAAGNSVGHLITGSSTVTISYPVVYTGAINAYSVATSVLSVVEK